MIFFSFYRVQWTGISLYWLQFFYVPTTELEGLLWYPAIFTGSLQGRITTQGDPCNLYREGVCSDLFCYKQTRKILFSNNFWKDGLGALLEFSLELWTSLPFSFLTVCLCAWKDASYVQSLLKIFLFKFCRSKTFLSSSFMVCVESRAYIAHKAAILDWTLLVVLLWKNLFAVIFYWCVVCG